MTTHREEPRRWQFEEMLQFYEDGSFDEANELFQKFLERGAEIFDPLANFLIGQPREARVAPLLELLGKIGDMRGAPILISYLTAETKELRAAAAISLGWMRARAGLEKLDELESSDPDEDVRRECQIAVEEILRDFPTLRSQLKYHESTAVPTRQIIMDDERTIRETNPPGGEERDRLVAMWPRLLALRYRAVPLGMGPGGVIALAVRPDSARDLREQLTRLLGRQVELHGWPESVICDRIISFYEYGDDDWIRFSDHLTRDARDLVMRLMLERINPEEPPAPLADCMEANEAVLNLLSICAQEHITQALIEFPASRGGMAITLMDQDGMPMDLGAPSGKIQLLFVRGLKVLAGIAEGDRDGTGRIYHRNPGGETFQVFLEARTQPDGRQQVAMSFKRQSEN